MLEPNENEVFEGILDAMVEGLAASFPTDDTEPSCASRLASRISSTIICRIVGSSSGAVEHVSARERELICSSGGVGIAAVDELGHLLRNSASGVLVGASVPFKASPSECLRRPFGRRGVSALKNPLFDFLDCSIRSLLSTSASAYGKWSSLIETEGGGVDV